MTDQKRIFSGVQPSGNLHIGNYLGAIKNWVKLQDEYKSVFCVGDLHAITVPQDPQELEKKTIEVAKIYLAAGIDPDKATIFVQSHLPQHSELMWILNTITKTGELFKMTQFKDKTGSRDKTSGKSVPAGLLNYPVLMAADIILHDTDLVPVGEDQTQHVEIARTLAKRFNNNFGDTFVIPEVHVVKEGMRIMGLDNPKNKMSKSADSKYNKINLLDSPDEIREKIKKAVTDSGSEIEYSDDKPAIKNLLNIFALVTNSQPINIAQEFERKGYGDFKESLAQAVIEFISPFQKTYHEIPDADVKMILEQGTEHLAPKAEQKMKEVKEKLGFVI
ncbi:MAG: tryptophan--tRNA ligase [Patescibacteria group bacterium]|nr:tryptophan--tRNA ligase [Patescibacteria group bacterium]